MRKSRMKYMLALLLIFAILITIGGYAEEYTETGLMQALAEMNIPTDVPLDSDESVDEAPFKLAILTLDPAPITIDCSDRVTLAAETTVGKDMLTWSSSNESVAKVITNPSGSVTVVGVGEGVATITCSDGEQVRTFTVTVNPPKTLQITEVSYPSSLKISDRGWKLGGGTVASFDDLTTLTSIIKNANGEIIGEPYTQVFDSGVKSFAIKEIDSRVPFSRILTEGIYTWILTAADTRGRSVSVNLPIRAVVSEDTVVSINPGRYAPIITLPDDSADVNIIEMQLGETKNVAATLLPDEAISSDLVWVSYDPSVATISSTGEITGVSVGSTTVMCRSLDNSVLSAGCTVMVLGDMIPNEDINPETMASVDSINGGAAADIDNSLADRRNCIPGTGSMESWPKRGPLSVIKAEDGTTIMDWQANPTLEWNATDTTPIKYSLLRNKEITISLYVRSDDADLIDNSLCENGGGFLLDLNIGSEPGIRKRWIFFDQISYPKLTTQWQRISTTLTLADDSFVLADDPEFVVSDDSWVYLTITNRSVYRMQIKQLQVELGGMATDWTLAPEDVDNG